MLIPFIPFKNIHISLKQIHSNKLVNRVLSLSPNEQFEAPWYQKRKVKNTTQVDITWQWLHFYVIQFLKFNDLVTYYIKEKTKCGNSISHMFR